MGGAREEVLALVKGIGYMVLGTMLALIHLSPWRLLRHQDYMIMGRAQTGRDSGSRNPVIAFA